MTDFLRFEQAYRALKSKDLLDAFPLLAKPVVEIGTTQDLAMFEPSMSLVPGFCLLPSSSVRRAIFQQIGNILPQRWLIILGDEDIVSLQSMYLRTQRALGMHGIQGKDAPLDHVRGQQWFEGADLILFLLHIAVP